MVQSHIHRQELPGDPVPVAAIEPRPAEQKPASRKGTGVNSIPTRFATLALVLGALCLALEVQIVRAHDAQEISTALALALFALCVVIPASVTWLAARKLTANIVALHRSTEAIIAGDMDHPVHVDCACEVGGLADSFRAMVARLNSNILRMNILAFTDQVTGLPNRCVVTHALGLLARAGDEARCAVVFIDLDGFKSVNDSLGHEAGDELLRLVSDRIIGVGLKVNRSDVDTCMTPFGELCDSLPTKPVVSRFAGDEFVIILPGPAGLLQVEATAEQLREALSKPFDVFGGEVRISASVGVSRMPDDTSEVEKLLTFADLAMYAAKDAGKNRVAFYVPGLSVAFARRTEMEAELRRAVDNGELLLHYQPKLCSHKLTVTGVEALVRWQHPQLGMVPPGEFIHIAEQAGLMHGLGASVIRMAAAQCRQWIHEGTPRRVSVNVSPAQFSHPNFVAELLETLRDSEVPPQLFEIEITESMAMIDAEDIDCRLGQIRTAGIGIAIDDFGTGFSNLSQLSRLPLNQLKIDRSLIREIGHSEKSQQILQAIVSMTHALGHKVVAEGVETLDQYAFLQRAGCDEIQGFLFGKPMDPEAFACWEAGREANHVALLQTMLVGELAKTA
ncbi:MAG: EAL domain-containing protein [Bradyrhizobium sp.]|uniref:EAL domain-containing protein n=1 Tax=Bradyrhizobium sp. TaxID=376 RepID=UPI0025BBFEF3|nr:EAL domain-containing protein [Bradyrhizobium sp.]MBI5265510.1 EAL domain-containing protein [Bradyrhizobium sp.]